MEKTPKTPGTEEELETATEPAEEQAPVEAPKEESAPVTEEAHPEAESGSESTADTAEAESAEDSETPQKKPREFRGLYKHVKISVKALDIIIIACVAVILVALFIGTRDPGYTATFDSRGGSDVASQKVQYGEFLVEPEAPVREGYRFAGWYYDTAGDRKFDFEKTTLGGDLTLYAVWIAE